MAPSAGASESLSRGDSPPNHVWFSHRVWCVIGMIVLTVVGSLIYLRSLNYDMIFDDQLSIIENESIQTLWPLFGVGEGYGPLKPQPETPLTARPVVSLAFAINYHFGGENPYGYRLAHWVMHIAAAGLLWAIVVMTLRQPRFAGEVSRCRHPLAIMSALIWLVHPCHTETVIYLTQRTELMMGLFYLLTLYCSLRYWESGKSIGRLTWLVVATLACIAGMLCKEMMASAPAMVLLYEWTFVAGTLRERSRKSWLLYLCLALSWLPIAMLYQSGYNTPLAGFNNVISAVDWWMTQSNAFFVYWKLTFVPWPLMLHYQVPTLTSLTQAWPGVLGLLLYAVSATWLLWRRNPIGFVMVWYFAALSPTLIVPLPTEEISERRLYVPIAAVSPLVVVGLFALCRTVLFRTVLFRTVLFRRVRNRPLQGEPSNQDESVRGSFALSQLVALAVAVLFTTLCIQSMPRLSDRQTIWLEVLKHQPNNAFAILSQGCVEYNHGDKDSGIEKMWTAFRIKNGYKYGVIALARALEETGQQEQLVEIFRKASAANPTEPAFQYNLAIWLENEGKPVEAIDHYRETIRIDPLFDAAYTNLAMLVAEQGNLRVAIEHLEIAVEINPDVMNSMNLMDMYLQTKQFKMAAIAAKKLRIAAKREGNLELAERVQRSLQALEPESP